MAKSKRNTKKKKKLTPRHRKFIDFYIESGNASASYVKAGYAENNSHISASRLLSNVNIQEYLEKRRAEVAKSSNITAEKIIQELAKIAFLKSSDVFKYEDEEVILPSGQTTTKKVAYLKPQSELPDNVDSAISSIRETKHGVEIKLHDKQKALEALSKYVGLSNDAEITKAKAIKKDEESYNPDPTAGLTEEEIDKKLQELDG